MTQAFDPRLVPARPDLAAAHLRGSIRASRYVEGEKLRVVAPLQPLSRQPARDCPIYTQALCGETVTIYERDDEGWCWGQLDRDGYVGYLPAEGLRSDAPEPTHRVGVLQTIVYPAATIKMPALGTLAFGSAVHVKGQTGDFAQVPGHGHIFTAHLVPLAQLENDPVEVAGRFLNAPYLWGGKSSMGIDCSGLVQIALQAAGHEAPRDTDMQEAVLGATIAITDGLSGLKRGDLVFWKGHVGIMCDSTQMLHASGHHMLVAAEPLAGARARIRATSGNDIARIARLA